MTAKGSSEPGTRYPPKLRPPGRDNPAGSLPGPSKTSLLILLALIVLLAAAAAVLFILPKSLQDAAVQTAGSGQLKATEAETTAPSTTIAAKDQPDQGLARNEAAEALEAFLTLKVQAQGENIGAWAGRGYQEVLDIEEAGDRYFSSGDYPQASREYNRAVIDLKILLDNKAALFESSLEEGYRFLSQENSEEALRSFAMALAINPDDQDALAGAQRAENLDAIRALYRSALELEQAGELFAAEDVLTELELLDKSYIPAQNLLARVRKNIEKQMVEQQMSSFFNHLENDDLKRAREALETIKKTQNGHPEVIQAEALLIEKEETVLVNNLKRRAEEQSGKEQWQEALASYQQILAIAPDLLFAVNGRDQANKRIELDQALEKSLSQPHRLQEDAQLETAGRLLSYARQFSPGGDRLDNQIEELDRLVNRASTAVPVVMRSDNMTDVVIYHVGKMGSFFSKEIVLKPGKYTVVGSRKGFRDIRTVIEVVPEKGNSQFHIACRDPI